MARPDLTGRWAGGYAQHGADRPLWAVLQQNGEVLTGRMFDLDPRYETALGELVESQGMAPGADEAIVARMRALFPDEADAPVRGSVVLPSESDLEGSVIDHGVRFLKRYRGTSFAGFRVGDVQVGIAGQDHMVLYEGRVSPDGLHIEGRWLIPGLAEGERAEGPFTLNRIEERESGPEISG
jgi:hypothetical protein